MRLRDPVGDVGVGDLRLGAADPLADGRFTATLRLDGVTLPESNVLARGEIAQAALDRSVDEATVMAAAELLGVSGQVLEVTLDYLRTRVNYAWWRRLHYATFAAWILVTIHGLGTGSDSRTPWSIELYAAGTLLVGGLIVSQWLTLYTTPVIYLLLDRLHRRFGAKRAPGAGVNPPAPGGVPQGL